jgi:phage FluMu protein Com
LLKKLLYTQNNYRFTPQLATENQNHHEKLIEKRCSNCNALLAKLILQQGIVEIKCKCGTTNTFVAANDDKVVETLVIFRSS